MKILFLPRYYEEGASSRYRTFNYLKYFKQKEYDIEIKPFFYQGYVIEKKNRNFAFILRIISCYLKRILYLLANIKIFDYIIIEKELMPYIPYVFERILLNKVKYTLDFDDAISTRYRRNKFLSLIFFNKINLLSKNAVYTFVGNNWYFQEIRYGNIIYLPTVIDLNSYPISFQPKPKNEIPIIVWIGSKYTVKYILTIKNVLQDLASNVQFKLRIIGGDINIPGVKIEKIDWNEKTEFDYIFSSDIGIMPQEEGPWENGKCGFKLIQYMASSLPVIASPSPASNEIIKHDEVGYIARRDSEWKKYLELLLKDNDKRIGLGKEARRRISKHYSYQAWANKYINYFA